LTGKKSSHAGVAFEHLKYHGRSESLIAVAKTDTTIDVGFIENKFTETKRAKQIK
jgi:hypothetical protein